MRRLVIAAAVGAAVVGTAVPSLAAQTATPKQSLPVGVTYSTKDGVSVGVTVDGRTAVAASVANGEACVGISLQVPACVGLPGVTVTTIPHDVTVGPAHAWFSTTGGVAAGSALGSQPLVGTWVANGQACVGFSEEIPFCLPLTQNGRASAPSQSLPIVFYHDDTRTVVGFRDVGVVIYADGQVCPIVSTQDWQCIPAVLG
jgi:hypothetical protein